MSAERVLDASVAGAACFAEDASELARSAVARGALTAPDLLAVEFAAVAAKKVRRGLVSLPSAVRAVAALPGWIDAFHPSQPLLDAALVLATSHRLSLYDAVYLALAQARRSRVLTLDAKFAATAEQAGLGAFVELLEPALREG